jgi:putative transposase
MPNLRRYYVPDANVFITGVTRRRAPYFASESHLDLFWDTLRRFQDIHRFRFSAYVILPDHLHCLMQVEDESGNFSQVLHSVKRNCTLNFKSTHGPSLFTGETAATANSTGDSVVSRRT